MDLPEIEKAILRESGLDLQKELKSRIANVNANIPDSSLLELAVGWPEGVRILLEFGADASKLNLHYCSYSPNEAEDTESARYIDSIEPLLQRGCILGSVCITKCRSAKVRSFLIDEYVKRLRKLHSVAPSYLPPESFDLIPILRNPESILDAQAFQVYIELIRHGWPIDSSFGLDFYEGHKDPSVYHQAVGDVYAWDDLYRNGFRNIDEPNIHGFTPLITLGLQSDYHERAVIWLVDKGADLSRRLPFSKTTTAHLLSSQMTGTFRTAIYSDEDYSEGRTQASIENISKRKDDIFLIPSMQDFCTCACCEGGCTTLLVALRTCNARLYLRYRHMRRSPQEINREKIRHSLLLNTLLNLTENTRVRDHSIIRLFTFEALGLRHTCCRELNEFISEEFYACYILDEEEAQNIRDEDRLSYRQFEKLVKKLNALFDTLELPIIDFLHGPWHKIMTQVLSRRDPYNEEHIMETRKLGIFLKPAESHDISPLLTLFGNQVEELESEDVVFDNYYDDDDDDDRDNELDGSAKNGSTTFPA